MHCFTCCIHYGADMLPSPRFGTNFIMAEAMLTNRKALQRVVTSPNWVEYQERSGSERSAQCDEVRDIVMDERWFWAPLQELVDMLLPVVLFLKMVDGKAAVMGKVYHKAFQVSM